MQTDSIMEQHPLQQACLDYLKRCPRPLENDEQFLLMMGFFSGAKHVLSVIDAEARRTGGMIDDAIHPMVADLPAFSHVLAGLSHLMGFDGIVVREQGSEH
jgi:hypothetical protein